MSKKQKTIIELKEDVEFYKSKLNLEASKKRKWFIKHCKIDENNIGENAWNDEEINKILERIIEGRNVKINTLRAIEEILEEGLRDIEFTFDKIKNQPIKEDYSEDYEDSSIEHMNQLIGRREQLNELVKLISGEKIKCN